MHKILDEFELERLKKSIFPPFISVADYLILFIHADNREMHIFLDSSNFGQIRPQTTDLAALGCLKYLHRLIMVKMVSPPFLGWSLS